MLPDFFARMPKAKFPIARLATIHIPNLPSHIPGEKEYFLIQNRRFICPQGKKERQWVYDGVLYASNENGLRMSTRVYCVLEEWITGLVEHAAV